MLKLENLIIAFYGIFTILFFLLVLFLGGIFSPQQSVIFEEISFFISPYSEARQFTVPLYQVYNLTLLVFSFALSVRLQNQLAKLGALCLSFSSLIGLALIRFPMDAPDMPPTAGGVVHVFLVFVMTVYIVTAMFLFGSAFKQTKHLSWLSKYSFSIGILLTSAGILTGIVALMNLRVIVGVLEKLPIGAFLFWVLLVSLGILKSDSRIKYYFSRPDESRK